MPEVYPVVTQNQLRSPKKLRPPLCTPVTDEPSMVGYRGLRMSKAKSVQHSFRLTPAMVDDIDWVAKLVAIPNGLEPNRTDGVRYAAHHVRRTAIKLEGDIGAGPPRSVVADHDEYVRVHQLYPEGVVCYRVRGDSMNDEMIANGDFVVVLPVPDADNGATVVVHLEDNGVVIKQYDKAKGMLCSGNGKGRWTHKLRPGDRIMGVLVGVIRRC